jgi:hypothetical protein
MVMNNTEHMLFWHSSSLKSLPVFICSIRIAIVETICEVHVTVTSTNDKRVLFNPGLVIISMAENWNCLADSGGGLSY